MARIKDASVEAVKAATDIVALVEAYTRLRKSGSRYTGLCPVPPGARRRASASRPTAGTFKCFGCGEGGDAITLRREAREPRLRRRDRVARRPLRRPARVRGDVARAGPRAQAPRAALPAARPRGNVLRAAPLGVGGRRHSRATTSPPAAWRKRCAASSGSALRRAGPALVRAATSAGLHARRAPPAPGSSTAAATTTSRAG